MNGDLRETAGYREAYSLYEALKQPGAGRISDASEVHVSPDSRYAAFTGTVAESFDGPLATRVCVTDLESAATRVVTSGPGSDRLPRFSPDGRLLAFLSDRHRAGDHQLYCLDRADDSVRACATVDGCVEYVGWSPDGTRMLLGVAGRDADTASTEGAVRRAGPRTARPSWMPVTEYGDRGEDQRTVWIYDVEADRATKVEATRTVWEAAWIGDKAVLAVASERPGEGHWYTARLYRVDLDSGAWTELYAPRDQLGMPAASPSGSRLAVIEAVCSDRRLVAGDLLVAETGSGRFRRVDTRGVDVTCAVWSSERSLLLAGQRDFETVVGVYDTDADQFVERWTSREICAAPPFLAVAPLSASGDCVLVGEGFVRAPELAVIRGSRYRAIVSFDQGYRNETGVIGGVEQVCWGAPDGIEIHGWLLRPRQAGPHPVVMNVHGGPVTSWRPMSLGRQRTVPLLLALKHGYAVFLPNPRGSAGRGSGFARRVLGDLGGADTHDYLAGIDQLVDTGRADPRRLGVMGTSYGGFMTVWLTTQDPRFAAAIPVAPVTNRVSQRYLSSLPQFVDLFLADRPGNLDGRYVTRSPIMYASSIRTPTLAICGGLDRCTPPDQAGQLYHALRENGVDAGLVVYPEEGHGVRSFPAAIDYAARVVGWFDRYLAA